MHNWSVMRKRSLKICFSFPWDLSFYETRVSHHSYGPGKPSLCSLGHFINGETEDWKKVKELAQGHRTSNGHAGALSWAVWAWSPALTTVLLVSSFKRLRCLDLWLKNFCDFFTSVPVWNQRNGGGRTIHLRVWNQTYSTPPSFQSSGNTPT